MTQTDGLAKTFDSDDMFWLSPDTGRVGDWFRAGGDRTFFKGQWHAAYVALEDPSGDGLLLSIDDQGTPNEENIAAYLEADLLDKFGFSEWVGPEPHGLGKHNTGSLKDAFTADETIALLQRFDGDDSDQPWLVSEPARQLALRYFDNEQFWIVPGEHGERLHRRKTTTVTEPEPEPDQYELYDLMADPLEQRSLARPAYATDASRRLQNEMLGLLITNSPTSGSSPRRGGTGMPPTDHRLMPVTTSPRRRLDETGLYRA